MSQEEKSFVCVDMEIIEAGDMFELWRDYVALLSRLHDDTCEQFRQDEFYEVLKDTRELLSFVLVQGQLVSMAQASLTKPLPRWQLVINNVVTHDDHQGCGYAKLAMTTLLDRAKQRWQYPGRPLVAKLQNSPRRENAGFYETLGFTARTKANGNETIVWQLQM